MRNLAVIVVPLLIHLIGSISLVVVLGLLGFLIGRIKNGASLAQSRAIWDAILPALVSGLALFVLIAIGRWVAFLFSLRRMLRNREVSWDEFAGWTVPQRNAWLTDRSEEGLARPGRVSEFSSWRRLPGLARTHEKRIR